MAEKKTTKKRARTKSGHYKADDPSTPDINEAWVNDDVPTEVLEEVKTKSAWSVATADDHVWYESKEKEPTMFEVAGISPWLRQRKRQTRCLHRKPVLASFSSEIISSNALLGFSRLLTRL